FAAAAQAMRRILVERARALRALRRGGGVQPATTPVDELPITIPDPATLLDLEVALRDLETRHPRQARVVLLRYFAGLEMNAIADVLGISLGSVERDWRLARARLARQLGPDR
ncbi:MAG: RNA polymerase subunit sigma, partial [Planctomycetes bacterium]|nr:RNA polymerase subunit sigma [Planctomycetota bacterium]